MDAVTLVDFCDTDCSSGGPAGAVYGFIFVWAGVAATFVVLSELASM
jgi:hypothetical protein